MHADLIVVMHMPFWFKLQHRLDDWFLPSLSDGMPPKVRRHILKASSHALAVDSLRKQRLEVQTTLRTMRATLKKDDML